VLSVLSTTDGRVGAGDQAANICPIQTLDERWSKLLELYIEKRVLSECKAFTIRSLTTNNMGLLATHQQGLLRQSPAPNKLFSFKQVKSVVSSRKVTTMAGSGRFFVGGESIVRPPEYGGGGRIRS